MNRRIIAAGAPAQVPAAAWLLVAAGLAFVCACGQPQAASRTAAPAAPPATATPVAIPTPSAVPAPLAAVACSASGPASASWTAPWNQSSTEPAIVAATAVGDTLTLTFDHGTPAFQVVLTSGTTFFTDPRGERVVLSGTAGVAIHLTGFRGDVVNFLGPESSPSTGPLLRQVREIGDFEGVVSWAVGLIRPACAVVTSSGSTLTFRFVPTNGQG